MYLCANYLVHFFKRATHTLELIIVEYNNIINNECGMERDDLCTFVAEISCLFGQSLQMIKDSWAQFRTIKKSKAAPTSITY